MDKLAEYRQIIRNILTEYARIPYSYGDIKIETVFDSESDRYLVMILGRENYKLVHGCLVHIEIINGKIWIQRDGSEQGMATELVEAGVPKEHIVLGFKLPSDRPYTGFAVD